MRQTVTSHEIRGFKYSVRQLPATVGRRLSLQLARAVLPALTSLLDGAPGGSKQSVGQLIGAQLKPDVLRQAVQTALSALPDAQMDDIIGLLAEHTDVYGPGFGDAGAPLSSHFAEHFAGRYRAMFEWLWFALKVNFADFFGDSIGATDLAPRVSADRR